jgi:hypothetical protein
MINDTITLITRRGFWSNDYRTFNRNKVKSIRQHENQYYCSSGGSSYPLTYVELESGEIIVGVEHIGDVSQWGSCC